MANFKCSCLEEICSALLMVWRPKKINAALEYKPLEMTTKINRSRGLYSKKYGPQFFVLAQISTNHNHNYFEQTRNFEHDYEIIKQ